MFARGIFLEVAVGECAFPAEEANTKPTDWNILT